jgi:hypothetical protein
MNLVPADVWWQVLACVIRMFPGIGRDSTCRDYGDAPQDGVHKVFAPAAAELDALLLRTRSLILIDWNTNREIHGVIRGFLTGLTEKGGSAQSNRAGDGNGADEDDQKSRARAGAASARL